MEQGKKLMAKPHYRLLTPEQIEIIHGASLEILQNTGIRVLSEDALKLLRKAGCTIKDDNIVLIPPKLVEESIKSAPSQITIFNRQGEVAMQLEGRNSYFGLGTDLPYTQDINSGNVRTSVLQDVINCARVADACPEIDYIGSSALPGDLPPLSMYVESFKAQVENSIKPIFFTSESQTDLNFIIEMAASVAGGKDALREKPFLIHYSEPISPLTHGPNAISKLLQCATDGIPVCYAPVVQSGATAPITSAGAIAQANAEALSGIVIHQLKAQGAPIISGFVASILDLQTMVKPYVSPEQRMTNSAMADLYHHYEIPVWGTTASDSNLFDAQTSFDNAICILMASLDGANLVHDVGYLGQGMMGNPAAIVMCDEIISYVRRGLRGFELDADHLALDTIHQVGPGGNYLTEEHTVKYMRSQFWRPKQLNRQSFASSLSDGYSPYEERLLEKVKTILNTHEPAPLSDEVKQKLADISDRVKQFSEGG